MGSYLDVFLIIGLGYLIWRGYQRGYISNWLRFGYNVLGWGIASIYASALNSSRLLAGFNSRFRAAIVSSNLEIDVSVASGSSFPNTNLPEQLNSILNQHFNLLNSQQEALLSVSEQIIVNILGGLACYLLIWLAVRAVFLIANTIIIKGNTNPYTGNSLLGILPVVGNALLCAMLLSGILWPFVVLFDRIGLAQLWEGSKLLTLLANMFYYIQINWII